MNEPRFDIFSGRITSHSLDLRMRGLCRFVICDSRGKPFTSGWVKNRLGKLYGYYFCERFNRVFIETDFGKSSGLRVRYLGTIYQTPALRLF
jgi:hypothetical protein